ncbi:MAG: hypothetical protein IPO36_20120 [Anaerolineales bacterium]|nr:hypothetical protein [Anaerolineales bacterium]
MKIFHFLFILCILILSACVTAPTATVVPVIDTQTPRPTFTITATVTETPPATFTPTPNVAPLPAGSFSPILYREYVDRFYSFKILGGVRDGAWITDDDVVQQIRYDQPYAVYSSRGFTASAAISNIDSVEPPYCGSYYVGSDLTDDSSVLFGFVQGWQVTTRPVEDIAADSPVYQKAVADWLIAQGMAQPEVDITRILRTDIEGDGTDEVFISASHFASTVMPVTAGGDYSIVLMRKVNGSEVVTTPLVADVYLSAQPEATYPYTYVLNDFLDLNQDANLEVLIKVTRWEGMGVMVYEVKDGSIVQAIKEICPE